MVKNFGYMMGGVLSILGLWQLVAHARMTGVWILGAGVLFLIASSVAPACLKPIYQGWIYLSRGLEWTNTRILLILLYIFAFVPMGLFLKILGKDLLDLKIDAKQPTYWAKGNSPAALARYEKQY